MTVPRIDPFLQAAQAEDDPFLAAASSGSTSLGPVEVMGVSRLDRLRALARSGDIQAALELATTQSNQPAMAQSQVAMRPTAAGAAADIAFSQVLAPVLPQTAEEAADMALERFVSGGGDAGVNANLFGVASALGAVGGNVGLGVALPNIGGVRSGMSLKQIGTQLGKAFVAEGTIGGGLAGGGALLEGASPEDAARIAREQFLVQGGLGTSFRALGGMGAVREAIEARVNRHYPEGRQGRIVREIPPTRVVRTDPDGTVHYSNGRISYEPGLVQRERVNLPERQISTPEELRAKPFRSTELDAEGRLLPYQRPEPPKPWVPEGEPAVPGVRRIPPKTPLEAPRSPVEPANVTRRFVGQTDRELERNLRVAQQNVTHYFKAKDDVNLAKWQDYVDAVAEERRLRLDEGISSLLPSLDESGRIGVSHGSPHKFAPEPGHPLGRFDISKIGTGEGAQAYGHGLYFAGDEAVAKHYRERLSNPSRSQSATSQELEQYFTPGRRVPSYGGGTDEVVRFTRDPSTRNWSVEVREVNKNPATGMEELGALRTHRTEPSGDALIQAGIRRSTDGALYRAEIDAEPEHFLDWDKPLSEQSDYVKERLASAGIGTDPAEATQRLAATRGAFQRAHDEWEALRQRVAGGERGLGDAINVAAERVVKAQTNYHRASNLREFSSKSSSLSTGSDIYRFLRRELGGPEEASRFLQENGIPGNRYLDANSRGTGQGSHNYVVFSDKPIRITGREGVGAPRILAGTAGGIGGAAYGATQGDTPEERAKNALLYGLGGLVAGVTAGYASERIGARSGAVAEAEREAGRSLAQSGRVGTRYEPSRSPFRDAPPPLKLLPDATPVPGQAGPVQGTPYVRLDKFGLDRDATARLRAEATRIGMEMQGNPRRTATWEEWQDAAKSIGLGDVTRKDYRAMQPADLLAIRNLVATNTDRLVALDVEAARPGLSQTDLSRIEMEVSALNAQNDLLLRKFIPARTAAGRNLNALRIIASRNFEPTWWLAKARDIKGEPLTDAELAQIRGLLNTQDREGLVRAIAQLHQASGLDKAAAFWKANLLSSPKTHLVNTVANAALGTLEVAKDVPAAMTDQLLFLATGRRSLAGPSLLQAKAAAEGARSGARDALAIMRGHMAPEELAKLDIPRETHFDNPILEGYTQVVFRALSAADRVPRMAALRRSLANQAEVLAHTERLTGEEFTARVHDLIAHPTTEMAVQATAEATQAVVQDQTAAGTALRAIGKIPVVGQFIMPFQRTPGAVATRIGEYTFGAPYELGNVSRLAAQGKLKDISLEDQRRIAILTGRGATGASLIALGALAYYRGWLTPPPADWTKDRAQAATDAMRQVQGNSLVMDVGGRRIQFDIGRLSPVGNLVAIGAMSAHAAQDRDPDTSPWSAGVTGALSTVANQPFLQGIQKVTEAASDPARFGEKFVGGIARGFVPASGLLGAVTRALDPNIHVTEGIPEQIQAQIPGLSNQLPVRPNPLGEPSGRQGGVLGAVSQVSPVAVTEQRTDPVLDAIGQYDVTLSGFSRKRDESMADYQARAARAGTFRRDAIESVLASPEWLADTSYEGRKELLERALRRAASAAARKPKADPFLDAAETP